MSNELKKQLWDDLADQGSVMVGLSHHCAHSEPMHAHVDKDRENCFWIFTKKDNRIAAGGKAMVQFVSKGHDLFACVMGTLVAEVDDSKVDQFWSTGIEAWYAKGKDDPGLLLMRFDLIDGEIWTNDPSFTGMLKLATGAKVTGKELGEHTVI
ncbi:pyridoxamine 5'-phosphate oxidase family protein [Paraglaciecola aquimarina]|uniref:Pyridoxamine 5'-phosphate oxidase family protein n=1 Tax=Paraglaciecola aquimarina TaxID=1235557 RepID=A0ABU3SSE4_9ALTE|nr:pyridoxamine 5'-phosphate oxidase family protein [Paraglaciecola aquimarina]MDU0352937.1 pyridoxamine 5'-phosphate oxidase family protein [Paraglaciecola aquimarina]